MTRTQRFPFPVQHLPAAAAGYRAGLSCAEIAQKYGSTRATTQRALAAHGVELRSDRKTYRPEQLPAMAEDYRSGMTYREIAKKYGGSDVSARRTLIESGVETRTAEQSKDLRTGRGIHDEDELIRLYLDGWKIASLARHLQVKNQAVSEVLRRRSVPLRPGGVMHPKFATLTQCEELADEYRRIGNVHVLAEKHECSAPTIIGALTRAGQPIAEPGSTSLWTEATIQRAVEMFKLGVPVDLIAKAIGTTYGAVRARLYEHGELGQVSGTGPGERADRGDYVFVIMKPGDEQFVNHTSNGQVAEHRLVMGRHLGRPVRPDETVHHIDGDRSHNTIGNLQLRSGQHGAGHARVCGDCGGSNVVSVPLAGIST